MTMDDFKRGILHDWSTSSPFITTLIALILLDIVFGLLCAFGTGELSSSQSKKGMAQKIGMILLVIACSLIDGVIPSIPFTVPGTQYSINATLGMLGAIFFSITEMISLTEKGSKLGLPMPKRVKQSLKMMQNKMVDAIPVMIKNEPVHVVHDDRNPGEIDVKPSN